MEDNLIKLKNIIFSLFLISSQILAQTNHIYLGGLGAGLTTSINYERQLFEDSNLFLRAGYGMFAVEGTTNDLQDGGFGVEFYTTKVSINPVIMGIHYLIGNKLKLDLGIGLSNWMISIDGEGSGALGGFDFGEEGSYANYYATIGFRYQNPDGGLTFGLGLTPTRLSVAGETGILPLPHLNIGYGF